MSKKVIKIVGQIIAGEYDENGDLVAEAPVAEITIYKPQFDQLAEAVAAQFPDSELDNKSTPRHLKNTK
jgi:hypothetical protein